MRQGPQKPWSMGQTRLPGPAPVRSCRARSRGGASTTEPPLPRLQGRARVCRRDGSSCATATPTLQSFPGSGLLRATVYVQGKREPSKVGVLRKHQAAALVTSSGVQPPLRSVLAEHSWCVGRCLQGGASTRHSHTRARGPAAARREHAPAARDGRTGHHGRSSAHAPSLSTSAGPGVGGGQKRTQRFL